MAKTHIMVDIETMGTTQTAPILSIGAVCFNASELRHEFHAACSIRNALGAPRTKVDGDTLAWWLKQSDDARLPIANQTGKYTDMMQGFHDWVRKLGKVDGVWGNGATFDNVILGEGFRRINMSQPWPFWADKCYRTIKSLPIAKSVPLQRTGVHHNALDDAKSQAQHLIDINSAIGGGVL